MNELNYIINGIVDDLKQILDKAGIYYRIFARQKSNNSIQKKLVLKGDKYRKCGEKMQDIIGVRIIFYFMEDVEIVNQYLHKHPLYLSDSDSKNDINKANRQVTEITNLDDKIFMPTRLNLIFRMDEKQTRELQQELDNVQLEEFDSSLIDNTYEIQLRTVLSEGWHEVEHDLRYKTREESWWDTCDVESRMLNGIYATLETSERAMDNIFSSIAYKNYKQREWSAMIRNHLKLHTIDLHLPDILNKILDSDRKLAKELFRVNRKEVIDVLLNLKMRYPLKMENILFLINRMLDVPSEKLKEKENEVICNILNKHV